MEQSKDPARRGHGGHKKRRQSQVDYISVSPSGQTDWALEMSDMNGSRVPTSDTWKDITGRRETKTSRRSNRIGSHESREGKKNSIMLKGLESFELLIALIREERAIRER